MQLTSQIIMHIKIPGAECSEDSVHEILKVVQEIKTSLNGVDGKLEQVLLRISTLEATVSPLKKKLVKLLQVHLYFTTIQL